MQAFPTSLPPSTPPQAPSSPSSATTASWWMVPRKVRWPIVALGLCGGFALTASAIRLGVIAAGSRGCHGSPWWRAELEVKATRDAVLQFAIDHGRCPSTRDELTREHYLWSGNVRDPWGTGVAFLCASSPDDTVVSVRSAGPDRTFDTADDIVADDISSD